MSSLRLETTSLIVIFAYISCCYETGELGTGPLENSFFKSSFSVFLFILAETLSWESAVLVISHCAKHVHNGGHQDVSTDGDLVGRPY